MNESVPNERTVEEIDEILELAKLNLSELVPTSQIIYFSSENAHQNKYKFLELDNHLIDVLEKGQKIYIKGCDDENVVFCTETRTYDVTETETSNSLLLVNNLKFMNELQNVEKRSISKVNVSGIFYEYLEVALGKPHLRKLKEILNLTLYKGPELEENIDKNLLHTYDTLLHKVQCSKYELDQVLKIMHVIEIDNYIRLLDLEYHFRVLSLMLKLIDENAWKLDEINYEQTIDMLNEIVPREIIKNLLELYTEPSQIVDEHQLYRYKESDICRFFAHILLLNAGKFNFNEFLQAWQESVPEGMCPKVEMLYGLAIIDRKSTPNAIRYFSEDLLPENVIKRFNVLFEAKEKWSVPEITPYIQSLTTDKLDVNALLAKFARSSTTNGVKYYSAKHSK